MRSSGDVLEVRPIEWYDGVVSGLVTFSSDPHWFYASLLGWSLELDERVYGLVPLSEDVARRMLALIPRVPGNADGDRWNSIQREVGHLKRHYEGKVTIVRCRNLGEPVLSCVEMDVDEHELRQALGQDIEVASGEGHAEKWLELLSQ